jgi:predicted membrane protein
MAAVNPDPGPVDPILVKRARIARLAELGQRIGYLLFGAAIVAFFVAFFVGFNSGWVTFIVTCMAVGSCFLAPAIVAGYAVKAADREDRGLPSGH